MRWDHVPTIQGMSFRFSIYEESNHIPLGGHVSYTSTTTLDHPLSLELSLSFYHSIRRCIQSAVIFEAYRSLQDQLPSMRPFQRKLAVLDQAKALTEAITDLQPHQRTEILWRTMSSKEDMNHEVIWKRAKVIEKELEDLALRIGDFCTPEKNHTDTVNDYVQNQYVRVCFFRC